MDVHRLTSRPLAVPEIGRGRYARRLGGARDGQGAHPSSRPSVPRGRIIGPMSPAGLVLALLAAAPSASPLPPAVAREVRSAEARHLAVGLAARFPGGPVLARYRAAAPMRPASVMKLLTAACALERLGPAYRFDTEFVARGTPDAGGTLHGPLWAVGGGDPLLRAEDLWAALRELRALGLRRIEGPLVGDAGRLEAAGRPPSWPAERAPDPYDAEQGALSLAWNSVEAIVRPAGRRGAPAAVGLFPVRAGIEVVNSVRTADATRIEVSVTRRPDGRARLALRGTIGLGSPPFRRWVRLEDPAAAFLAAAAELAPAAGIELAGGVDRGTAPPDARPLGRRASPDLATVIRALLKHSLNGAAETVLRGLAAADGVPRASTGDGLLRLRECLAAWKVPLRGLELRDGSGLAPSDRLTADALVSVLLRAWERPAWGPELLVALPRAGEDGSLAGRLGGLRGRLRAKTGSLRGVAALAGYAWTRGGRPVAFAVLVNGAADRPAPTGVADRLARAIVAAADELEISPDPSR
ncbi:MAG: D-alanyl-D-alanine carboxypeptidase/D-alanyl-D-alanine-endopeptidase [Acidobacteria bacterium]|nr:MAG: D-alanyl-D-alanine carboxypeptidase/D-alanyl-D-alanine-endopeptidase [Acidobacteriota bacterium]